MTKNSLWEWLKKGMMRQFKHIYVDLYMFNIYWVRCSWKEYIRLVKNEFDENVTCNEKGGRFATFKKEGHYICVIWIPLKASYDILAHEVFHCVHYIMGERGIYLTDASEEAYAYLLQYIMKQIES